MTQAETDRQNEVFWNELCGSHLAAQLGIRDDSPQSLAKFDQWYFDFYPYLFRYIPFGSVAGRRVLEVGLGYGTVAERLAASGAQYHGLDIAAGPVAMVSKRLQRLNRFGDVRRGSILDPPFEPASFDRVVAIGSLHHTGNLQLAIQRVFELLKPTGSAVIMVYSANSYRQWLQMPGATWRRVRADPRTYVERTATEARMRALYDANAAGDPAPQTEFVTGAELAHLCREFRGCSVAADNIDAEGPFRFFPRRLACTLFGPLLGLDLYCRLDK